MDDNATQAVLVPTLQANLEQQAPQDAMEVDKLKKNFQDRLLTANLRTEAIKAGMIDLDGLKLIDTTSVYLDHNDNVVDGQRIMAELRRSKPWLFGTASSSSKTTAPASQPVRQKTALEMTENEYIAAKNAITKYHF